MFFRKCSSAFVRTVNKDREEYPQGHILRCAQETLQAAGEMHLLQEIQPRRNFDAADFGVNQPDAQNE
jgi:hypothetical protein